MPPRPAEPHFGEPGVALVAGLNQHPDEVFLAPGVKRFAAEVDRERRGVALHFAPLDRQIDFAAARITGDNRQLETESFFEQLGQDIAGIAAP